MSSIWTVRRSDTDAKLTGLCGGVAEHWGIDPVLVRVGWVLLGLSGGVGLVLYVAGWLLVPVAGRATAPVDDLLGESARGWSKEVWVTIVVAACLAAFATFGSISPFGVGPAVVLACIWYFGFYRQRQGEGPAAGPSPDSPQRHPEALLPPVFVAHAGPSTPFTEAAQAWRRRIEDQVEQSSRPPGPAAAAAAGPAWPSTAPPPAPAAELDHAEAARRAFLAQPDPVGLYVEPVAALATPVGRRGDRPAARRLRLLMLLVMGLATGGLAVAEQSGLDVSPATYAATALLVVGLALVAATWFGRARGLLPLGLLLVPVVLLASVPGPLTEPDHWDRTTRVYTKVAELPAAGDSQVGGQLSVDLSRLTLDRDASYAAHLGTGHLEVLLPEDVNVALRYDVQQGVVTTDGRETRAGADLTDTVQPPSVRPDRPTLTVNLSVDRGKLEVRQ